MATAPPPPSPPPLLLRPADADPIPPITGAAEDAVLFAAELLSREEVLRRRSRRVKQLARHYKEHYWALVEEVRSKLREYYWSIGVSPLEVDGLDTAAAAALAEGSGENDDGVAKKGFCRISGCKSMAMPLTRYCHGHILCDDRQTLYKPCTYETCSSGQTCGKPVLRAAVPPFCTLHIQKARNHLSQVFSREGFRVYSSGKPAPGFHVIIAEYIRQIQINRRKAPNAASTKNADKAENAG
ncbi:hypothetical protein MUK42_24308 [Musa troglodytarum]|uniref:KAT8 regulatory NSL complex subunit 2 n=1 Tax=Musa troglodytarum TaxID=320322 RepID=A0A9E7G9H2_9LILI|nr:hypothetical protein MUK42_24308 [Musa troglodytarum]URE10857.1 hypothetical protein MUK42_24308 [Musa troglodytarum]URE10858.1 hypothetical protein MUK42_24308 [Musa troglodytarum]